MLKVCKVLTVSTLIIFGVSSSHAEEASSSSSLAVCEKFGPASMPKKATCSVYVRSASESFVFLPHYLNVKLSKPKSVGDTQISGSVKFNLLGTDGKEKYDVAIKGQGTLTISVDEQTHGNNPYNCGTQLYSELKLDAGSCHGIGGDVIVADDGNCKMEAHCLFSR